MSALKAIFSRLHVGEHEAMPPGAEDRRLSGDRRKADRRGNVFPFYDREQRLRFAAQAAGFGTYDFDCLTGHNHLSPELKAIAGLPQDLETVTMDEVETLIHPDDRPAWMEKLKGALDPAGSGDLDHEHRLVRPDGVVRWVRVRGRTFFMGSGEERRPLAATGIVMDVTDARAAAQKVVDSRAELSGILDSAIDAIISVDVGQRIVRFNPAACRMFRCTVEEAIGSPLDRFIPERFRTAHQRHVHQFAEGGATARTMGLPGVFSGLRADGEEFPIEATIAKVRVDNGWQMTVFLRDITERIRAEAALQRSKADLELAVRGANIGIWHWDLRSGTVDMSARCRQLFGVVLDATLNFEHVMAAIHPDDRDRVKAALQHTIREGVEYKFEKRVVWKDGSVHWLECIGRDLHDERTGEAVGLRGISLEITERKRLEETLLGRNEELEYSIEDRTAQLIRANEALERSNLELQQFAFIAAHDLQTPLRSISGFAQLLRKDYEGRLDPQAEAWLDQLVRSVHRMRDVVHDILAYSRVESRGNAFRPTDFNELVDDVLATLDAPMRETGARVRRDHLPTVLGDRTQLAQVLQNLIDNALKYHGQAPPDIRISARREAEGWEFRVQDNGIGIAEKHLENIFDIFRRLHTQQEYPGTGIGLAICRRVVHRHGGRIWVDSLPGKGSTFHFTLPDHPEGAR
ncbi:MAG TPA: PAS domain S-box protein [Rhodocyclaceae bacterium]|nr:PAS domain S-box protein [Rhodocyclaceae bacterium]